MNSLLFDREVPDVEEVLNDLNRSFDGLRGLRDKLTSEDSWSVDYDEAVMEVYKHGVLLAAMIRHMEQLVHLGLQYEFARRQQPSRPVPSHSQKEHVHG